MKTSNKSKKERLYILSNRIEWVLVFLLIAYILVNNFNLFPFFIIGYLLMGISFYSLLAAFYFKKTSGAVGIVRGNSAIYWGIIRFLFYFTIGFFIAFYYKKIWINKLNMKGDNMKTSNKSKKEKLYILSNRIEWVLLLILIIYMIVARIFNFFPYFIVGILFMVVSLYSLLNVIYFKKGPVVFGVVGGKTAIIWGVVRFVLYFLLGLAIIKYS